jgi:hypothetical protein
MVCETHCRSDLGQLRDEFAEFMVKLENQFKLLALV